MQGRLAAYIKLGPCRGQAITVHTPAPFFTRSMDGTIEDLPFCLSLFLWLSRNQLQLLSSIQSVNQSYRILKLYTMSMYTCRLSIRIAIWMNKLYTSTKTSHHRVITRSPLIVIVFIVLEALLIWHVLNPVNPIIRRQIHYLSGFPLNVYNRQPLSHALNW